uniref:Uncharacterized protein n=1 Tax=Arundo donax TaxID=35708 RepID=A0A0A9ANV7_ARUDO
MLLPVSASSYQYLSFPSHPTPRLSLSLSRRSSVPIHPPASPAPPPHLRRARLVHTCSRCWTICASDGWNVAQFLLYGFVILGCVVTSCVARQCVLPAWQLYAHILPR